ncbi:MAG: aminodeoxychorismate/anthranilate synthase component II [Pseudomonadales bacterium]|nr:aminodeoxychorismate/anthranilate synthase component II [Pseudomonadales bacterium]
MILMIDNYDSFTYNVVQYLQELGANVDVYRNDEITLSQIEAMAPTKIVISPGPCTPNEAGISMQVVETFSKDLPILGICLGHQSIGQVFGGKVVRARQVMHGKTSPIFHNSAGLFKNIAMPFTATRYHSLIVEQKSLPDCLEVTAWTQLENGDQDEIMGFRHREFPLQGIQFHPESILTLAGHDLLQNFLDLTP